MTEDQGLQRIEKALSGLGSQHVPPAGWEARVLAATVGSPPRPSWLRRLVLVGAPVAVAVAVLLIVIPHDTPAAPLKLSWVKTKSSGTALRADNELQRGDVVRITASGGEHRALWVYCDRKLILDCSNRDAGCSETDNELTAPLELNQIDDYVMVALSDDEPLERPKGSYDADVAHALEAGATVERHEFTIR
jgi:hypothetical protein